MFSGERLEKDYFPVLFVVLLTLALWPTHIPDRVRMAARIISGFPVSMSCTSKGTPLFWNILSAPASSLDRTIRLLAA